MNRRGFLGLVGAAATAFAAPAPAIALTPTVKSVATFNINPWSREGWNLTEQARYFRQHGRVLPAEVRHDA